MEPSFVAEAALRALNDEETGRRVGRAAEPRRPVPLPAHPGAPLSSKSRRGWGGDLPAPHIWLTLGYRSRLAGRRAAR